MIKNRLVKKFRCALCDFHCCEIDSLQHHASHKHECDICGKVFYDKAFHSCLAKKRIFGGNNPTIKEPRDSSGKPIFQKESSSFRGAIAVYSKQFKEEFVYIRDAVESIKEPILSLLKSYIAYHGAIKIKLTTELLMHDNKQDIDVLKNIPVHFLELEMNISQRKRLKMLSCTLKV